MCSLLSLTDIPDGMLDRRKQNRSRQGRRRESLGRELIIQLVEEGIYRLRGIFWNK